MTQTVNIIQGNQIGSTVANPNSVTWGDLTDWSSYNTWRTPTTNDIIVQVIDDLSTSAARIPTCEVDYEGDLTIQLKISDTGAFAGEESTIDFVDGVDYTFANGRYYRWQFTVSLNSDISEPFFLDATTSYSQTFVTEILSDVEVYAQEDSDGFYPLTTNLGNVVNIQATALQGGSYVVDGYIIEAQGDDYTRSAVFIENVADETQSPSTTDRYRFALANSVTGDYALVSGAQLYNNVIQCHIGEAGLNYGTGDWCWEAWIYPDEGLWQPGYSTSPRILRSLTNISDPDFPEFLGLGIEIDQDTNGNFFKIDTDYFINGTQYSLNPTATYAKGQWHHIAFQRSGTKLQVFANGSLDAETTILSTDTMNLGSNIVGVGSGFTPGGSDSAYYEGLLDEVRISTVARYTDGYTPQQTALINDPNTQLLLNSETVSEIDSAGVPVIVDNTGTSYGTDNYIIIQKTGSPVIESKNPPRIRLTDGAGNLWDGAVDAVLRGYPKIQLDTNGVSTVPFANVGG